MAYIGKEPAVGNFVKLDAISTSSTNSYSLTLDSVAFVPESANHMLVSLNGVIQAPQTSFSVSGSTITFLPSSGTLSSSDSIDFIMVYGNVLDIGTPSDSTVTNAKTNFVSTSSSAGLQIKGDGTTDGTLQLNCSQNSHGIKLASPSHSSGQSYKLIFPTGNVTADKFLKVASVSGSGATGIGQLSFADAGGGGMTLLNSGSVSSTTSQLSFNTTYVTSTYRHYRLLMSGKVSTDNTGLRVRYRTTDGSSTVNSGYAFSCHEIGVNNNSTRQGSASYVTLTNQYYIGNGANEGFNMVLDFMSPLSNTVPTQMMWNVVSADNGDSFRHQIGASRRNDGTEQHGGLVVYMTSGDFTEYTYEFYGYNK